MFDSINFTYLKATIKTGIVQCGIITLVGLRWLYGVYSGNGTASVFSIDSQRRAAGSRRPMLIRMGALKERGKIPANYEVIEILANSTTPDLTVSVTANDPTMVSTQKKQKSYQQTPLVQQLTAPQISLGPPSQ